MFNFLIIFVTMKSKLFYIWLWRSSSDSTVKRANI
jgi:hypothetical protein